MQATFPLRRVSVRPILIVLAIAAALICSAAGGYWLRSLTSQAATVVTVAAAAQSPSDAAPGAQKVSGHPGRILY
jgi:hypothetical protein